MIQMLGGERFFEPDFPIFVNRETESFKVKFHQHDFIELCLVEEGHGFQHIGDEVIPVQKEDLFLLPVGTPHVFRPSSPQSTAPLVICNCIFKLEAIEEVKHWIPQDSELYRILYAPKERMKAWYQYRDRHNRFGQLFHTAYLEYHQRFSNHRTMLKTILLQILLLLQRTQTVTPSQIELPIPHSSKEKVEEIIQHVNQHVHEPLLLHALADAYFMSVSQLQQRFKAATGHTFTHYIQQLRIERSCELLETTGLTVQQVAHRVGYTDMKFFHALFRRIAGCTPKQYRKKGNPTDQRS
ncbi:helix-turn-helix domain-containing protein [Cohnella boryungensis]|uniref:Helix-turn-helix domain-containing protein n=1 Tax=Cohnella boryungensis TaxID=768479 RepID=A0ABV8SA22_9BACL